MVGWIRILVGKNDPRKRKVKKCFAYEVLDHAGFIF
jgi:hypothetical protein